MKSFIRLFIIFVLFSSLVYAQENIEKFDDKTVAVYNDEIRKIRDDLVNLPKQTADLDMGSHKIITVTDPTTNQDAATKTYVDTAVASAGKAFGSLVNKSHDTQ